MPQGPLEQTRISPPVFAIGPYDGPLRQAIINYKYRGAPWLSAALAEVLFETLSLRSRGALLQGVTLVPVPVHPVHLASRGYNQAALLAAALAAHAGIPWSPKALLRARLAPRQAELNRSQRQTNIRGQFKSGPLPKTPVVLVDDVCTTGSTLFECAEVIKLAGGRVSHALTIAIADAASGPAHEPSLGRAAVEANRFDPEIV